MQAMAAMNPILGPFYMGAGFLILLAIGVIAINFFVTYLEFMILAILSLALIPFGALKWTQVIAEKVGNMLFAFGVRIMILSFLAAVSLPILENWVAPDITQIQSILYMIIGSLGLAFLSFHAPSVASSLLNGSTSLHAGHVMQPIANAAQMVAYKALAAPTGGASVAVEGVQKGMNAVKNASGSLKG
jgi:type IV secretion system protein TrbL